MHVTVSAKAEAIHIDDVIMQPGERIVIEPNFDSEGVIDENVTYEYDEARYDRINKHGVILALSNGTIEGLQLTSGGAKTKLQLLLQIEEYSVDSVSLMQKDVKLPVANKTTIKHYVILIANNQKGFMDVKIRQL